MNEFSNKIREKAGKAPGTLIHVGSKKSEKIRITVIDYDDANYNESEYTNIEDCFKFKETKSISWINIDGLHDVKMIDQLGKHFDLHPLLLEDILNTRHRPKTETFDDYIFLTLKMLGVSKDGQSIINEQVSFVLGKTWVISFQERQGDIFDMIRERLKANHGSVRKLGSDYLLYRLIDTVVDNYFFVTEYFNDVTEKLENQVLKDPGGGGKA